MKDLTRVSLKMPKAFVDAHAPVYGSLVGSHGNFSGR